MRGIRLMWIAGSQTRLKNMFRTGSGLIDAEYAFTRARRASRRAALARSLRRDGAGRQLRVFRGADRGRSFGGGLREIPLDAIHGTLEPSRASHFDACFRPITRAARTRWERIWLAEDRGAILPPISVVAIGDGYAVLDGHHRVSVARSRGAVAIDATVESR
jgi:hypothetical protein